MISVFDTSIAAYNSGNQIIMDSVLKELDDLFPYESILRLPVEDIGTNARRYSCNSIMTFVGGTNILNGDIRKYRQWDLNLHNIALLKECILMGCGWFQYESQIPTRYTKWALSRVLSNTYIHSVRDEYTKTKLSSIGINAINTGCVTLWRIDPELKAIKGRSKSKDCVMALTDYNQNPQRDLKLFDIAKSNYSNIYLFVQGTGDIEYAKKLNIMESLIILRPRLTEFNRVLLEGMDYIGTRLHAGIRALQLNQRSIILGIDNRAKEMARDFNLPVVDEAQLEDLENIINSNYNYTLNIPLSNIRNWKAQFKR